MEQDHFPGRVPLCLMNNKLLVGFCLDKRTQ